MFENSDKTSIKRTQLQEDDMRRENCDGTSWKLTVLSLDGSDEGQD